MPLKLAIVGRPNVGKSTLLNHLVGQKVSITSNKAQTTRNRIYGIVNRDDTQFILLDTPGLHRPKSALGDYMVKVVTSSLADVDCALLLVEPIPHVGGPIIGPGVPTVLIGKLPAGLKNDPSTEYLRELAKENTVTVVHLIYRSKNHESNSKDYDFSHVAMVEHWEAGVRDVHSSMRHKDWLERPQSGETMVTYDLTQDGNLAAAKKE